LSAARNSRPGQMFLLATDRQGFAVTSRLCLGCGGRTRALADGYDRVFGCALERDEPAGLLADLLSARGLAEIEEREGAMSGPPIGVDFDVQCPSDARRERCGGEARLLGSDGRTIGETAFDFPRRDELEFLVVPVSEQEMGRVRAVGRERAALLLDMPGVPQRRYELTLVRCGISTFCASE